VPLCVEPNVARLLLLLGRQALREGGVSLLEVIALLILSELLSDALKDLSRVLQEAPHVLPDEIFEPLRLHAGAVAKSAALVIHLRPPLVTVILVVALAAARGRGETTNIARAAGGAHHESAQQILSARLPAGVAPVLLKPGEGSLV